MTTAAAVAVTRREVGDVSVVTLDDGKANVLTLPVLDQLDRAMSESVAASRALVLAGRAGTLCAGLDLAVVRDGSEEDLDELMGRAARWYERILRHPQPVVVASTGHALAGGALILLCADLRIGADGPFVIGVTEVAIGLALPRFGYTLCEQRLDRRYLVRATTLAERFSPAQAVGVGFLDELADDPIAAAVERAAQLTALDPGALLETRARVYRALLADQPELEQR